MKFDFSIGLTVLALVSLAAPSASAQALELAASQESETPSAFELELDRAGFYGEAAGLSYEEIFAEAISDFEHHIGWPETGRASPAVLGALREYNTRADRTDVQF